MSLSSKNLRYRAELYFQNIVSTYKDNKLRQELTADDILISNMISKIIQLSKKRGKKFEKKDFFQVILENLYDFEKEFEFFLVDKNGANYIWPENNKPEEYFKKSHALIRKISLNMTQEISEIEIQEMFGNKIEDESINVLSFNYTDPYSKKHWGNVDENSNWNKLFSKIDKVTNVHGQALSEFQKKKKKIKCQSSTIIFGIDDKSHTTTDMEYSFTKTFRTMVLYADSSKPTYAVEENVFDENIKVIKFYGHSLAEADYSYFQAMFDYYNLYNNNDLKLYFYFSIYSYKTSDGKKHEKTPQEMILEQADKVTKLIEKYGETLDNKNHGKNLLTRLIQTKRLFIKEIKVPS